MRFYPVEVVNSLEELYLKVAEFNLAIFYLCAYVEFSALQKKSVFFN